MNQNILEIGFLSSVKIYCWGGSVKIDPKTISEDAPSEIVRAMQDIISDKTILKKLRKIKNQVFYFMDQNSMPFPLEQAFFVPKVKVEEVSKYLEEMRSEYFQLVDSFIGEYDKLKTKFKSEYPKQYKIVQKRYPDITRLKEKFRFDWNFYSINMPNQEGFATIDKSVFKKEKARFNALIREMEESTIELIRSKLVERIEVLAAQCKNGTINRATMNSIDQVADQWKEIWSNCMNEKSLSSAVKSVKLALSKVGDVERFKSNEALQIATETKLGKILDRLQNLPNKRRIMM